MSGMNLGEALAADHKDYVRLREAVIRVVTQQADDLCWMDVYRELAGLVGVEFNPLLLPREKMLSNCARYVDSLLEGKPYAPDELTAALSSERTARVAAQTALEHLREQIRQHNLYNKSPHCCGWIFCTDLADAALAPRGTGKGEGENT